MSHITKLGRHTRQDDKQQTVALHSGLNRPFWLSEEIPHLYCNANIVFAIKDFNLFNTKVLRRISAWSRGPKGVIDWEQLKLALAIQNLEQFQVSLCRQFWPVAFALVKRSAMQESWSGLGRALQRRMLTILISYRMTLMFIGGRSRQQLWCLDSSAFMFPGTFPIWTTWYIW